MQSSLPKFSSSIQRSRFPMSQRARSGLTSSEYCANVVLQEQDMHVLRKTSKLPELPGHMLAGAVEKIVCGDSPSTDRPDLYAEHKKCFWLVDDLNDVLIERKSKADVQDMVRRLLAVVATHFRHEEELFSRYGYLDGPRHSELHSEILVKYRQWSNELNKAVLPAVWTKCGSLIGRMLEEHLEEEQIIYRT